MKDLIILLIALWIASVAIGYHITRKITRNTYKTSISLKPNLSPIDAIKIAQYFVKQRCKTAKIKRITILYTVKTNVWVIWREDK